MSTNIITPNGDGNSGRTSVSTHTAKSVNNWLYSTIFLVLLALRLVNSFSIETFFQPDEFYQGLEPAHNFVFGYGYVTWEWREGLRSAIHPFIYAIGYKLADLVDELYVTISPKVIGALLAALGELHLYMFVKKFTNNVRIAQTALMLSVFSPFNWYIITRSFSNTLEMVLTTVALAYWPWKSKDFTRLWFSCGISFITCIIRPTNAIIWIVLGTYFISILNFTDIIKLMGFIMVEFVMVFGLSIGVDFLFYGFFTIPLVNFVQFNVVKNLSVFYGSSPWHFYLFQSVPIILMTYLPFFIHSIIKLKLYKNVLGLIMILTIALFSMIDHKEFRFIYPLMPIFMLFTSYSVERFHRKSSKTLFRVIAILVVVTNVVIAYFFTRINERGEIDIINYLKRQPEGENFGLLTPCHSTPWQSHLHDIRFQVSWFITCEPPLHLENSDLIKEYRDESDLMFDDPKGFILNNFPTSLTESDTTLKTKYQWPSKLIIYEAFEEMAEILTDVGYTECHRIFNSYFHWDSKRNGDIVVYCRN